MARPNEEASPPPEPSAAVRIKRVADEGQSGGGGTTAPPITTAPPVVVVQPPAPPVVITPPSNSQQVTITPPATVSVPATSSNAEIARIVENLQTAINSKFTQIGDNLALINDLLQQVLGRVATVEQKTAQQPLQGLQGPPGKDGSNGKDGKDGVNGRDGKDGSLFVATPEYAALDRRIDAADGKAAIAQSSADAANAKNSTQDASIKQLRDTIANLSTGAPVVPVGPTATEIAFAVSTYLKNNPISNGTNGLNGTNGKDGVDGKDGKGVSLVDITAAVNEKINSMDFTDAIRKLIPAPVTNSPVTNVIGVTADEVKSAIAASLKPLDGLLTDSEAFVWGMILNASDEFWALFLERLDQIDFEKDVPQ